MNEMDFALQTIWADFQLVAKVNVLSGEFIALKSDEDLSSYKDIFAFAESPENMANVFVHDRAEYRNFINREAFLTAVSTNRHNSINYRRLQNGSYHWVNAEIIKPADFSLEKPFVILTGKGADEKYCNEHTAVRDLSFDFHKILKVNLNTDKYQIIKIRDGECPVNDNSRKKFSYWVNEMVSDKSIYDEDCDVFTRMTSNDYMHKFFSGQNGILRIRYRRKSRGTYRWVVFEAIPAPEYSEKNSSVMIYIRDIEDEYSEQIKLQRSYEKICYEDALTGIQNRMAFQREISEIQNAKSGFCGIIYTDLNGLKYVNDHYGHKAGDGYLKTFADFLRKSFRSSSCYRIGGDEFVVILKNIPENLFVKRVYGFEKASLDLENISFAIGSCWSVLPAKVERIIEFAEKEMYAVKSEFHKKHAECIRVLM